MGYLYVYAKEFPLLGHLHKKLNAEPDGVFKIEYILINQLRDRDHRMLNAKITTENSFKKFS